MSTPLRSELRIPIGGVELAGLLDVPAGAVGLVVFVHGSGSSRFSPRNLRVAELLRRRRFATLVFDLLTGSEAQGDATAASLRFDIGLLADRLIAVTDWVACQPAVADLPLAYFGASTGAAAALIAAARRPELVAAVVSRGGRPELAGRGMLATVRAPVLLIVGGADGHVLELNRSALVAIESAARLAVIPGATHLFTEPGALDEVARLTGDFLIRYLGLESSLRGGELGSPPRFYADRREAGRHLGRALRAYAGTDAIVLALPRGGVPVADEVARMLALPLDVCIVRKLGAPGRPELGLGAIAEGPRLSIDRHLVEALGVEPEVLHAIMRREAAHVRTRTGQLRADRPLPAVAGRTVIVVDDGLATGGTMRAAVRAIRKRGASRVVVAAPVGAPSAIATLCTVADDVVCPLAPADLQAVGTWYEDFRQMPEDEVIRILRHARARATDAHVARAPA